MTGNWLSARSATPIFLGFATLPFSLPNPDYKNWIHAPLILKKMRNQPSNHINIHLLFPADKAFIEETNQVKVNNALCSIPSNQNMWQTMEQCYHEGYSKLLFGANGWFGSKPIETGLDDDESGNEDSGSNTEDDGWNDGVVVQQHCVSPSLQGSSF
jgi:hypothetical protein